ncbi:ABC transporter substrate-binding protein [Flavobacteriaceae bacterium R38]|nr:ABC transporter substrate-binding protein [Flavobacteriaceae bacterium R38]
MLKKTITFLFFLVVLSSCKKEVKNTIDVTHLNWEEVIVNGSNKTVTLMMWQGDQFINNYVKNYIAPAVKEKYNITLNVVNGQGNVIVQTLLAEIQAGKSNSNLDLLWINGETFYQLRQINALFGPFTAQLPNSLYVDYENPFIGKDFQKPTEGYEMPWGNVQMTLIYDSKKVEKPPKTREEFLTFVKEHPGKFTFDNHFTGLTFLKALLIDIAGGQEVLSGAFNEAKYNQYSKELWDYVKELKPYLWKKGETFPEAVATMHQLFANGELWFTMSNNDAEVDNKISEGLFSEDARAYVPNFGTIQNSHYMGIPKLSSKKEAAMLVANFMISPEAQLKKMDPMVWGDGTVLSMKKLNAGLRAKFKNLPSRKYAPKRTIIQQYALQEIAPEYMIRLAEDFRQNIILN